MRRHYKNYGTVKVMEGTPDAEESLESTSENRHRGCGRDICWGRLFQLRAAATGKARSPTGGQRSTMDIGRQ